MNVHGSDMILLAFSAVWGAPLHITHIHHYEAFYKCTSEKHTSSWHINAHGDLVILNVMQLMYKIAHPTATLWLPTDHFVNVKIRQKILFLESLEF